MAISTAAITPAATAPIQSPWVPLLNVVAGILTVFGANPQGPTPPSNPFGGFLWGLFRQFETSAGAPPPVAGTPTVSTPDPATGTVTGTLGASEQAGLPLTYKVATNPANGTFVELVPNSAFTLHLLPFSGSGPRPVVRDFDGRFGVATPNGNGVLFLLVSPECQVTTLTSAPFEHPVTSVGLAYSVTPAGHPMAILAGVSAVPPIVAADFIMLSLVHAIIAADAGDKVSATKAAADAAVKAVSNAARWVASPVAPASTSPA